MSNSHHQIQKTRDLRPPRPHVRLNSNPEDLLANDNYEQPPSSPNQVHRRAEMRQVSSRKLSQYKNREASSSTHSSQEKLLPPRLSKRRRRHLQINFSRPLTTEDRPVRLDSPSTFDSKEECRYGPVASPMVYQSNQLRNQAQIDLLSTQTVAERYKFTPLADLMLFPDEVEPDDWLHSPTNADDEKGQCGVCSGRGLLNLGGLVFLVCGILFLFIGYPVLTYVDNINLTGTEGCKADPDCISNSLALLDNVRKGLIDPETPDSAKTRKSSDGAVQYLVFSDEFNADGRTFFDNDDPYFQAVNLWYGVTQDLEWYDPDAVTTANGTLNIRFDAFKNHGLDYRSGMLQSWNQLCVKGGYVEASISLPGSGNTSGFWPGFWTMGNLGRPGYASTTDGMWPYSYWDKCDFGITANQSHSDGISYLPGMKLPACACVEDESEHPSVGTSRSAPELDAIEASVGPLAQGHEHVGTASQSAQFAPFDIWYLPNYEFAEIYDDTISSVNMYRGSVYQEAFSVVTNLNNQWYDGKAYQTYGFEYVPGAEGYVLWYVGKEKTWKMDGRSMGPNGNVGQRIVPEEPMALVVNFGMSESFAQVDLQGINKLLPATMRIDYIRIYQDGESLVTCDPPGYPTTDYINSHPKAYKDPLKLVWKDTGYRWPRNSFVDGCSE